MTAGRPTALPVPVRHTTHTYSIATCIYIDGCTLGDSRQLETIF